MTDKFTKAKWEAYQGLNDEDIMDAIQGCTAIPLAIKLGDWDYAFKLIKERIDNKMIRRTELDMYNTIKTASIDDDEEMRELKIFWLEKEYEWLKKEHEATK
jgi:hypothetical protein